MDDDAFGHWLAGFIDGEGCFAISRGTTPISSSGAFRAASGVAARSTPLFPVVPDDFRDTDRHIDPEFREDECGNCGGLADDAQPCRYCGLGMWGAR